MSYDNNLRLALWKNDRREKQTHPHLKGSGEVNSEYWVSAWFSGDLSDTDKKSLVEIVNRYDSKKPFISISLQEKQAKEGASESQATDASFDSDIPF